ncbi:siderophore iron transporter [Niveomyces insectorum RCEF 264]|uniref:Siderophore iron transporter n=1 Tax=Niveomyces insectorum RCEF 264 TaxID=1081102 RepID=A0A167QEX5_9HYPO|nr:siderophore iron transporter [Niveomyces insectorum RCEF 264]
MASKVSEIRPLEGENIPPSDDKDALTVPPVAVTDGVLKVESISRMWSGYGLALAWLGMILVAIAVSLNGLTISSFQPYALSEFGAHAMLAAITTLQNILNAAAKPFMAKLADVWGRCEAISLAVVFIVVGFIINASSHSLGQLASGQIFYAIGYIGIEFLQQVLTADTTTLENRSFFGSLILSPAIFTAWISAPIVSALVPEDWRWGYGMWAIIYPVISLPLLLSLWWHQRKLKPDVIGSNTASAAANDGHAFAGTRARLARIWTQFDPVGLVLFTASLVLILLPMTLATNIFHTWHSAAVISMIVLGGLCFVAFVVYELYVPRFPILSLRLAKNRTVAAGCMIDTFLFLSYYMWSSYLYSFFVVANAQSAKAATNIITSQGVATATWGLTISLLVKKTGNVKWVAVGGTAIKLIGGGLMLRYTVASASVTQIVFGQIVSGMGTGMISIVVQTAVQAVASHQDVASVTTLYESSRAVGAAVGTAISGAIWTTQLPRRLHQYLPATAQGNATAIASSFVVASSFAPGSPERVAINRSYEEVMHILMIVSLVLLVVPLFLALAMENIDLFEIDKKRTLVEQGNIIGAHNHSFKFWSTRRRTGDQPQNASETTA